MNKTFRKRFTGSVLGLVLVAGMVPGVAFAQVEIQPSAYAAISDAELAASSAVTSQMQSPKDVATNASATDAGTAANPYDIVIGAGAFTAPSKFWGSTMVVTFRQTNTNYSDGTTLFSYTFDTSKADSAYLYSSSYAFRFSPYTGYDTTTGNLRIGTASKGDLALYFPTFDFRVNVVELTKTLDADQQIASGDEVEVVYYGGYDSTQTSRGQNYTVNLNTTDTATTYDKKFTVDEDGFIDINPLPKGGNYVIKKVAESPELTATATCTQIGKWGQNVTFTCTSSVTDGVTYQWQWRKSDQGNWKNCTIGITDQATMTLPGKKYRSNYQYRCVVTDAEGTVVETDPVGFTKLSVEVDASPITQAGETETFTCTSNYAMTSYRWQYQKVEGGKWRNCTIGITDQDTMQIVAKKYRANYHYRCIATTADGVAIYSDPIGFNLQ